MLGKVNIPLSKVQKDRSWRLGR